MPFTQARLTERAVRQGTDDIARPPAYCTVTVADPVIDDVTVSVARTQRLPLVLSVSPLVNL